jgi:O-acetylserine/cysteine efflux transporter
MTGGIRAPHLLAFTAVMAVWGLNFAVAKIGLQQLPPILMMALRFFLVALLMVPFVKPPTGHWRQVLLISFTLGLVHFSLLFLGLVDIDAATAALTIQLQVPFATILAAIFLKDRFGWRRSLGLAIAFVGVAIIAGEPRLEGRYGPLGFVVAGAFVWAVANIQIKMLDGVGGLTLNAWIALFAAPQLAVASWFLENGQLAALAAADWRAAASVAYQAIGAFILGYGTWQWLLRQYKVSQAMPFTLLVPFFGVLSGVVVLGEDLTFALVGGGLLTVLGVAIIVIRRPQTAAPEAERV